MITIINNKTIEIVRLMQCLGVALDSGLTFSNYVDLYLYENWKKVGSLGKFLRTYPDGLENFYNFSKLYLLLTCGKSYIDRLQILQNNYRHIVQNCGRSTPITELACCSANY